MGWWSRGGKKQQLRVPEMCFASSPNTTSDQALANPGRIPKLPGIQALTGLSPHFAPTHLKMIALASTGLTINYETNRQSEVQARLAEIIPELDPLADTLLKQVLLHGGAAVWPLVQEGSRRGWPDKIVPLFMDNLLFKTSRKPGTIDMCLSTGATIANLGETNAAFEFLLALDPLRPDKTVIDPVEPVLGIASLFHAMLRDFMDTSKLVAWPRIVAAIDQDKLTKQIPSSVVGAGGEQAWVEGQLAALRDSLAGLKPSSAISHPDWAKVTILQTKDTGSKGLNPQILETLQELVAIAMGAFPQLITGKALDPSIALILTQTLQKLRSPVARLLSRALTTYARYVDPGARITVRYRDIELRPHGDLAATRAMDITTDWKLLTLGAITPEEFCRRSKGDGSPDNLRWAYANPKLAQAAMLSSSLEPLPSGTDTPVSPGLRTAEDGDGRSQPDAVRARGGQPNATSEGRPKNVKGKNKPARS